MATGLGTLVLSPTLSIEDGDVEITAIRSQGAGGQNVNKVSTAIQLRFDIGRSSLPERLRERLLASNDRRITSDGVLVIKAQRFRSQELNRRDALDKLRELIEAAAVERAERRPTRPTLASKFRRLESKSQRSEIKRQRRSVHRGGDE